MSVRRSERTELQQKVAQIIDAGVENILNELAGLHASDADVAEGIRLEAFNVDLEDAWADYCDEGPAEEPDGAPVERWEVTTPAEVYRTEDDS